MAKKSDLRKGATRRGRMSATAASRSFAHLLDRVEAGAQVLIHRRGKDVCLMSPPPLRGQTATQCLEILKGRLPVQLDGRFGKDLLDLIAAETVETSPWDS